jgi:hypothetical protein
MNQEQATVAQSHAPQLFQNALAPPIKILEQQHQQHQWNLKI